MANSEQRIARSQIGKYPIYGVSDERYVEFETLGLVECG